jgi:hypothetical protein
MGADPISAIVTSIAGPVIGKVLGGGEDKSAKRAAQAQQAETDRLEQQRKDEAASAEKERKTKSAQRRATSVIFGGAENNTNAGVGNLGG